MQDLRPRGVRPCGADIFQQGVLKELCVLEHKGDSAHQVLLADLPHIHAADKNPPLRGVIEAGNELCCGGFAAAGSAHQRDGLSRRNLKRNMVQSLFIRTGVAEGHIFKGHGSVLGLLRVLRLRQGLFLQNALDAVYSAFGGH